MKRTLLATLGAVLLLPSGAALAGTEFDYLMGDAELFEQDLDMDRADIEAAEQEHRFQLSEDLLPPRETDGALEQAEYEPYVSVRVDGVPVELSDVPSDTWFAPYVRSAAEGGIVSGYRGSDGRPLGRFGPGDPVTMAQLAKMAVEATGHLLQDCAGAELRNETARGDWSEPYILCAEQLDFVVYSDGSVDIRRPATRAEVVVTVLQAFGVTPGQALGNVFSDVTASTEFSSAIERAAADNVVSGYAGANGVPTGDFGPDDPVNRAEMAKIISLAVQTYGLR